MTIIGLILAAFILASTWWLFRTRSRPTQTGVALLIIGLLVASSWLPAVRDSHVLLRGLHTLACFAVLTPKLLDACLSPSTWRGHRFRDWLAYLLNPFVLVYRAHLDDPGAPVGDSIRRVAGGLLRMSAGAAILFLAFRHDFTGGSFWVEHAVKTLAVYLLFFDGQFVTATGLMRIITGRSMQFSRSPIVAHSPANFWRRYNRDAGRFLFMDLLVPLVGKRALLKGTAIVFIASGVLHEYLSLVMSGRLLGYQMAFFGIQGAATMLTLAWRPRGVLRLLGVICTLTFNLITSALFFASVDLFVNWYDADNPLAWS